MKMIAINKHSGKLKFWSVEMPNAPYSNRCLQCDTHANQAQMVFASALYPTLKNQKSLILSLRTKKTIK
jgi:hypothetical protein